jgi:predicted secreted Zn-dependent protease
MGQWAVLAALPLAACGPKLSSSLPMPPGVVPMTAIRRYQVHGSTVAEITRSLRQDRADATQGFVGYHSYRLRWTYRYQGIRGSCRFTQVRVEVHSAIDAPEWQRPPDAPAELAAQWEQFMTALDEHERGHARIAIEGAGEIARMFQRAQDMSCMTLRTDADREAHRCTARCRSGSGSSTQTPGTGH